MLSVLIILLISMNKNVNSTKLIFFICLKASRNIKSIFLTVSHLKCEFFQKVVDAAWIVDFIPRPRINQHCNTVTEYITYQCDIFIIKFHM